MEEESEEEEESEDDDDDDDDDVEEDRHTLLVSLTNQLFSLNEYDFVRGSLYKKYIPYLEAFRTMKANDAKWTQRAGASIEFRFPQLGKQCHLIYPNFISLLDVLYPNGNDGHTSVDHPANSQIKSGRCLTVFHTILRPLYTNGSNEIPHLNSPGLKLFFSTTNIKNGDWVQFYGPGTLFSLDESVPLTLAALCVNPRGQSGGHSSNDYTYKQLKHKVKWETERKTSNYSIGIRWEK